MIRFENLNALRARCPLALSAVLLCLLCAVMRMAHAVENDGPPFDWEPVADTRYIKVTSLSDSGRGTLRECALAQGSRVCLFEVGGTIKLKSDITIRYGDIFIAGQTAPAPGITLTQAGISIQAENVEIQHLAIRPGDSTAGSPPGQRNAISVGGYDPRAAYNVSLRNLSLTWAVDENFSTWYPTTHDVWLQNSIIAEGLNNSIHPKGPHSDGVLIGTDTRNVSLNGNLIAFNFDRNPYAEPGTSTKFTNNVVYGWGTRGPWNICNLTNNFGNLSPVVAAFIGNLWIPAGYSYQQSASIYAGIISSTSQVYVHDNLGPGRPNGNAPDSDIASLVDPSVLTDTCPFSSGCSAALSSSDTESFVLSTAGSRPKQRSSIDTRIISDVRNRAGSIKDCLTGCPNSTGRIPSSGTTRRSLRVPSDPAGDSNGDGVSNFDEWLLTYTNQVE